VRGPPKAQGERTIEGLQGGYVILRVGLKGQMQKKTSIEDGGDSDTGKDAGCDDRPFGSSVALCTLVGHVFRDITHHEI
jgi:hypothetical protein